MGALKLSYYDSKTENKYPLMKVVHNINEPSESRLNSYLFGSQMPGRSFNSNSARNGFNGKEKIDEWNGNSGAMYDYGARFYDARLGRPFTPDPITREYPELSPYQFFSNNPILFIDLDGLEGVNPNNYNFPVRRSNYLGSPGTDYRHATGFETMGAASGGGTTGAGLDKFKYFYSPGVCAPNGLNGVVFIQRPMLRTTNSTVTNAATAPVGTGARNNVANVNGGFVANQPNLLPGGIGQINAIAAAALPSTTTQAIGNPITQAPIVSSTTDAQGLPVTTTTTTQNQPIQVTTVNSTITVNLSTRLNAGTVLPDGTTGAQLVQQRFNAISAQLQAQGVPAANIVQGAPQFGQTGLPNGNQTTFSTSTTTTTAVGSQSTTTTETKDYTYGE